MHAVKKFAQRSGTIGTKLTARFTCLVNGSVAGRTIEKRHGKLLRLLQRKIQQPLRIMWIMPSERLIAVSQDLKSLLRRQELKPYLCRNGLANNPPPFLLHW